MQNKILKLFEDQLILWPLAKENYKSLSRVKTREIAFDDFEVIIQFNPERVRSVAATPKMSEDLPKSCFLCKGNLPEEQQGIPFGEDFTILCNPFPVFSKHLTIASNKHIPQLIKNNFETLLQLAQNLPDFAVFYNGPQCGASAPEHLHFQAGLKTEIPLYNDFIFLKKNMKSIDNNLFKINDELRTFFVLESDDLMKLSDIFYQRYPREPLLNILVWYENDRWTCCVFERKQHRPKQYFAEGESQILVSPATVEMAGLIITPRLTDFEKITKADLIDIFGQVVVM